MKKLVFIYFLLVTSSLWASKPGVTYFDFYMPIVKDKHVAFVGNQTAQWQRKHTLDILLEQGVNVKRIFAPEHGFRGTADAGATIKDGKDTKTGLPIVSLYGKKKKPLVSDLQDIDLVIFDLQDVGTRFYTYISTLHYIMESCAENNIPLLVFDRPNPNAFYVDGPVLKKNCKSFVGMHPVPIVYGMTIGEYARMINGEGWLKDSVQCDLTIVPLREWNRDEPEILPISPSPNLPDAISTMLYPSVCLFEGTVVSEGRGTHFPFQCFGHPQLKDMPFVFTPKSIKGMSTSPKCLGKECYGRDLRHCYPMIKQKKEIYLDWLIEAYSKYEGEKPFFISFFDLLIGDKRIRPMIEQGKTASEIKQSWKNEVLDFMKIREKYLIYPTSY